MISRSSVLADTRSAARAVRPRWTLLEAVVAICRHDRVATWTFGIAAVAGILPALPGLGITHWGPTYFLLYTLALAQVVVAMLANVDQLADKERHFWQHLAVAYAFLTATAFLFVFNSPLETSPGGSLVAHFMFAILYLLIVLALERRPHRLSKRPLTVFERALVWPAVIIFFIGIVGYLMLIPITVDHGTYQESHPYLLYYLFMQVYLTLRLVHFARIASTVRWRWIYGLLVSSQGILMLSSMLENIALNTSFSLFKNFSDFALGLSILVAIAAARVRHFPLPHQHEIYDPAVSTAGGLRLSVQTLGFALVFPVLHILLGQVGLLDDASQPKRESFAFFWMLFMVAIAFLQRELLERRARMPPFKTGEQAEPLSSDKDLRLILERREMENGATGGRYEQLFYACPELLELRDAESGETVAANHALACFVGSPRHGGRERDASTDGFWLNPADQKQLQARLKGEREVRHVETTWKKGSGETRTVLLSAARITAGGRSWVLTVARPIGVEQEPRS